MMMQPNLTRKHNIFCKNDAIKTIIVPTTIGLSSAAKALKESGKDVNLIGLGFPSELSEYIKDGTCDRLYIWNTTDLGYLTAYTLKALDENEITGSIGETFTAGSLGEKTITADKDNASEIILGDPIMFDRTNIDSLSDILISSKISKKTHLYVFFI